VQQEHRRPLGAEPAQHDVYVLRASARLCRGEQIGRELAHIVVVEHAPGSANAVIDEKPFYAR